MAPQGSFPLSQETISGFCYECNAINGGLGGAGSGAVPPGGRVQEAANGRQGEYFK
jgi:hypothetical protein